MLDNALQVPEADRLGSVDDLNRVVDADAQVQETPEALLDYMVE